MKVLGWIAVVIAVLSVLFGISPVLIAIITGDEGWQQAGWAFMFATVPLGVLGIVVSSILAIISCLLGMSRGAAGPGVLGVVGIIGAIVVGIASGALAASSGDYSEQILAIGMLIAIVAFIAGLVGTIWAGFAARPRA